MITPRRGSAIGTGATAALLALSAHLLLAQTNRAAFPARWGSPPAIQTRDYVELPGGYGHGSSTLAKWIAQNLEQDKHGAPGAVAGGAPPLYRNDFSQLPAGNLPDEFMVLNGDFTVAEAGGNKFMELPGAPLETFSVLFGPSKASDIAVSARIFGTMKGRRAPAFGVGLGGASGYKLRVSPGKNALELLKDEEVRTSAPFDWKPGAWTLLRLQIRKARDGEWRIEGKAWAEGGLAPANWSVSAEDKTEPIAGRASVFGSPFSGTPIRFDDLEVSAVPEK